MNAANEVAVEAFLTGKIGFMNMPDIIEKTMNRCSFIPNPELEDYINSDRESRLFAESMIK